VEFLGKTCKSKAKAGIAGTSMHVAEACSVNCNACLEQLQLRQLLPPVVRPSSGIQRVVSAMALQVTHNAPAAGTVTRFVEVVQDLSTLCSAMLAKHVAVSEHSM
jgi:hypothetical protein